MRALLGFSTIKNYRLGSIINGRDETVQPAVHMLPGPDPLLASLCTSSLAFILHWCQHQICSAVSAPLTCSLQLILVHYPSPSAELCWIRLPQIHSPLRNRCSWGLSSQEVISCSMYSHLIMTCGLSSSGASILAVETQAGCQAGYVINHPAFHMAAVLLFAPGVAVGLLGLLMTMTQ